MCVCVCVSVCVCAVRKHCSVKTVIKLIGASLSEPHIDELNVRNLYIIIIYGTSVTRAPPYTLYSNSRYIPEAA